VPGRASYDYAVLRVVPRVEREEFLNAGVVLFCLERDFLSAKTGLDRARLQALFPAVNVALVEAHLAAVPRICAGGPEAGPIGLLTRRERFHWLVAPRSTILQVSPVHVGLCQEPEKALEEIFARMVGP